MVESNINVFRPTACTTELEQDPSTFDPSKERHQSVPDATIINAAGEFPDPDSMAARREVSYSKASLYPRRSREIAMLIGNAYCE